ASPAPSSTSACASTDWTNRIKTVADRGSPTLSIPVHRRIQLRRLPPCSPAAQAADSQVFRQTSSTDPRAWLRPCQRSKGGRDVSQRSIEILMGRLVTDEAF